jgi:hypothetical protein
MVKSQNISNFAIIVIIIAIIIFIICAVFLYNLKYNKKMLESFSLLSPYQQDNSYPGVFEEPKDKSEFTQKLKEWEKPFNKHNEGYYNAEPCGRPPLVPLYSFTEWRDVQFSGKIMM